MEKMWKVTYRVWDSEGMSILDKRSEIVSADDVDEAIDLFYKKHTDASGNVDVQVFDVELF